MKLSNQELIEEFFKRNKDKYPDITIEEMKKICFFPWVYAREHIESGELPVIRLKYFGSFQVYEGRARNMINKLRKRFKENKIEAEQYYKLEKMLEKYLEQYEKDND